MSEKLDRLEAELAAMRPRALPAELTQRIEAGLEPNIDPPQWSDRFLLSAIASGALAACVIVAMLLKPSSQAFPTPAPVAATAASDPPRAGDYSLMMARADFGP